MHIEFLVEEESAEATLHILMPKLFGNVVSFTIHVFQGKHDLLEKLPQRLTGYSHWLPNDWRIVVLVDEDRQDCQELKTKLEETARAAGLMTWSMVRVGERFQILNRLAIEELEAWFFGDPDALVAAYPRVPANLGRQAKYRNPDEIAGGTWEALERVLQRAGYYPGGLPKVDTARQIAMHMLPDRNKSRSFQKFRDALRAMIT